MKNFIFILSLSFLSLQLKANNVGIEACRLSDYEESQCEVAQKNGKKLGPEICRAPENPEIILRELSYSNGEPEGSLICRDFLGQVYLKARYLNGKLTGEHSD